MKQVEQLKTNIYTNLRFERTLCFVIECVCIIPKHDAGCM